MKDNPFQYQNVRFLPILHNRLEFVLEVHRQWVEFQPEAVAVELPPTLQAPMLTAVQRLPYLSVILYQEKSGHHIYLPIEPVDGIVEAIRLGMEKSLPVFFIDRDTEGYPQRSDPMPDPYSVTRIGYQPYCLAYLKERGQEAPASEDVLRERTMASHALRLNHQYQRVLLVCGLAHWSGIVQQLDKNPELPLGRQKRSGVIVGYLKESSSREILSEFPFLQGIYEKERASSGPLNSALLHLDRTVIQKELLIQAGKEHLKNSREKVEAHQTAMLRKFARNLALLQGGLSPDFYQLLIAARGMVNDNFAYEVWELGSRYPFQETAPLLPEIEVTAEDLRLNQKQIRFYRRFRTFRRRLVPVPFKKRSTPAEKEENKKHWTGRYICSFPPEDIRVEGLGDYVKKKVRGVLSQEQVRVIPFSASLLDGLDIRETLRQVTEQKFYVREEIQVRGRVGSVVFVFHEDEPTEGKPEQFPWKLTWLGEHNQESDMAFYATPAGEDVVGPGISRCEYGGFVLSYPPYRMVDIWKDRFFNPARSKAERLLLAGIDYSEERLVAYIAVKPPRSYCHTFAHNQGRKIIYLPLGQFSPVLLTQIRFFHVLESPELRKGAHHYIR
ncbi:MAG: hypothetical protein A2Y79_00940 [Deltaproteobacteria bacterium RBG_13_43_22]|nr:MAG: hypothetical protein A2Y79_00940 [Deltaproteobacteria bacterium RBG_13_43_22]